VLAVALAQLEQAAGERALGERREKRVQVTARLGRRATCGGRGRHGGVGGRGSGGRRAGWRAAPAGGQNGMSSSSTAAPAATGSSSSVALRLPAAAASLVRLARNWTASAMISTDWRLWP